MKKLLLFSLPALIIGLVMGSGLNHYLQQPSAGMYVTFENQDSVMIESIQLNFGNANGQSDLLTLRLAPGEQRLLLLNHDPGLGFNVSVRYAGGDSQEFCARQSDDQRQQTIALRR
ncbi:hypothetical protein [Nitrincola iocasae]|jgi:hypothetical protein|uniref:Uncharacterized protein n=1 Tax=Nitrincola iocasae TaxID=2614693 RepID=A0A5J6LH91_9GAMM|nr:hypothetical protein [Nitrincola iocasae]QEW07924.1 hypothetical protein F5I99_16295 [Nitrincola iocasae]